MVKHSSRPIHKKHDRKPPNPGPKPKCNPNLLQFPDNKPSTPYINHGQSQNPPPISQHGHKCPYYGGVGGQEGKIGFMGVCIVQVMIAIEIGYYDKYKGDGLRKDSNVGVGDRWDW